LRSLRLGAPAGVASSRNLRPLSRLEAAPAKAQIVAVQSIYSSYRCQTFFLTSSPN